MTKQEIIDALKQKGVNFDATASKSDLEALLASAATSIISSNLLKVITEGGGLAFTDPQLQASLQGQLAREYPDFGREITEGVYTLTGYATRHEWQSPRSDTPSIIWTAYATNNNGDLVEIPFAAFSASPYSFVSVDGSEFQPNTFFSHFDSTARRNLAVVELPTGTQVRVRHARGHHKNPYSRRIFDFLYTWVEKV